MALFQEAHVTQLIAWQNSRIGSKGVTLLRFDKRGTVTNWGIINMVLPSAETEPDYNSIILAQTRINMGKMDGGGNCNAK
jgi:hypothetical protein